VILTTFNVQRGRRPDRVIDLPLLAETCASLETDVLALQEVTEDQPPVIAAASDMHVVFGSAIRGYGNALLSRHPIDDVEIVDLPFSRRREPRSAILASTAGVTIAATHLGLRGDAVKQLPVVVASLLRRTGPHILVGDLNTEEPDVAPLELVVPQRTFPAHSPRRRIDHVAVDGLLVASVAVLDEQRVGDHRPVVVALEHEQRRQ
jgi:endonuclease/exonuclease/phosphatase family metal-dependent hydrolase